MKSNGCYKFKWLVVFLLSAQINGLGQTGGGLKGEVFDTYNHPVDYFNISLFSASDSSFVRGGAFTDGYFEMDNLKAQRYHLKISSVQYLFKDTVIDLTEDILHLNRLYLEDIALPEFVAVAKRPLVRHKAGVMILDVKNSFLKDAGQLSDVLKQCPGITVDYQGNVSAFGKGAPVIFINGKEVYSREELTSLAAMNIESIEIDHSPSSEYAATGHVVIRVKTGKPLEDYFSVAVLNSAYWGRRFSDRMDWVVNNKYNRISNYFGYSYTSFASRQHDVSSQTIIHPADTVSSLKKTTLTNHNNYHNLFYSMDYAPNEKTLLGVQYSGSMVAARPKSTGSQTINASGRENNRAMHTGGNKRNYLHNFSANYTFNFSKTSAFFLIGDYAFAQNKQKENILEQNHPDGPPVMLTSTNRDNFNVSGIRAEFNSALNDMNYKSGIKYSEITDKGEYDFDDNFYSNNLKDKIIAHFISLEKSFGSYSVKAGLRGEYTFSNVGTSEYDNLIDTAFYYLFPSLQVNKKFSEKTALMLTYSKRITRPGFSQLNPRFTYLDSLSYMVGNPSLKPAISDVAEIRATFSGLSLSAGYKKISNQIVYFEETDAEHSNRVKYTFNNIRKGEYWLSSAVYTFSLPNISGFAGFYFSKPFVDITFLDTKYQLRKPIKQLTVDIDYNPFKSMSVNASFFYRSSGETGLDYFKASSNLTLSAKRYFLNKKLYVAVSVEDVLKMYNPNDWETRSRNIISTMDSDMDSRRITVKISYDIGNLKVKNSRKSANEEERDRL